MQQYFQQMLFLLNDSDPLYFTYFNFYIFQILIMVIGVLNVLKEALDSVKETICDHLHDVRSEPVHLLLLKRDTQYIQLVE